MRPNRMKAMLAANDPVALGWCSTAHPLIVETVAQAGFDAVALDMQHGAIDTGELLGALQAISTTSATPLVRVPWNDPAIVMKALDLGAMGIISPMIESAADVEKFVAACRYPPAGMRSFGPTRARLYAGADYALGANDQVLTVAMIETRSAMANLAEILAVPGLDALFVGPADLSLAHGGSAGADWTEGVVPPLLERVLHSGRAAGIPVGIFARSPAYAARMVQLGFSFVTLDAELSYVERGAVAALHQFRQGLSAEPSGALP
jgi:4-hydroxy-2-oxoheptanedioate aldolase